MARQSNGRCLSASLFQGADGEARLEAERQAYMDRLWADTVGFAAAKMIRRILGLAHNIDLEWIEDKDRRATCEARALTLARDMMVNTARYPDIRAVTDAARRVRQRDEELLSRAVPERPCDRLRGSRRSRRAR